MELYGITGRARAGKDTLARALIEQGFIRLAFADPLKHATAMIAGEDPELFFDDKSKEEFSEVLGMTRRLALQLLGTEGVRKTLGADIWVRRLILPWVRDGRPNAVITDVRFDNEAEAIRAVGGKVVRVVRPDNVTLAGASAVHASEAGVSDHLIDHEIVNDGTVEDLWEKAKQLRIDQRFPAAHYGNDLKG